MGEQKAELDDAQTVGVRHNADGTTDCCATPLRWIMRINSEEDYLVLDSEVVIEGDEHIGYRLSAPFTAAVIQTIPSSQIIVHGPIGGRLHMRSPISSALRTVVDQHALLTRAVETGERVLRLSDFVVQPPEQRTP